MSAQRCTLDVMFTPEEVISLREWRLVWVADPGDGRPLRVVASEGTVEPAEACDVRQDRGGDRGARIDTAYFCAAAGTAASAPTVRFVLDAPSEAPTRISLVPVLAANGKIRAYAPGIAEASINGGSASSFPPILVDVEFTNAGDATTYRLFGAYLGEIRDARIRQPLSRTTIPIQILNRSNDLVEVKGPLLEHVRSGLVEVRNRSGQWAAIPIEWSASGLRRTVAPQLAVQLDRSSLVAAAEPGTGDSAGATTVAAEVADALARAGVVSLRSLFPEESGKAGRSEATNLLGEPIDLVPLDDWFVATLGLDAEVAEVLERVCNTPGVREAFEDNWRYLANLPPNDQLFSQQWGLQNSGDPVCGYSATINRDIGAVSAWDQTTGNPAVRVCIIDTGINWMHEDFGSNRVKLGPDFYNVGGLAVDDNGHGTSVAGIAAALGNNSTGVAGTAWQVQPWAVKVLSRFAGGTPTQLSPGILWASGQRMPILNMSLGWPEPLSGHDLLADATLEAFKRGLFLVASSGNADEDFGQFVACPAHLDKRVYAVGAFLPNGLRWQDEAQLQAIDCDDFDPCLESNFGDFLDAMAPGGQLITTTDLGSADYLTLTNCIQFDRSTMAFGGTSAAAPYVSGIAGLLLSRRPELIGEDIAQILNRTTSGPFLGWEEHYGWGRVKASSALNFVGPGKIVAHWGAGPGPFSLGSLQVIDSTVIDPRTFRDVPGMPPNVNYTTSCVRYRLQATLTWPFPFAPGVVGWTRSSGTFAWKDIDFYDYRAEVDTATFVPDTFGPNGVIVEAFVFRVIDASNPPQTLGWFPTDPAHARVALTVIGYPAGTTDVGPERVAARLAVTTLPNPSRGAVKMAIDIPARGHVRAMVLDLAGRRVATLVERELEAGRHEFSWDGATGNGSRCPAGVYFCRVDCGGIATMSRFIRLSSN